MKIAIIGTRGIPNHYGGFEQFAEFLSKDLANKGHDVMVFNSHNHPYKEAKWNNVNLIHKYDPEYLIGTFGQFVYDFNCIWETRKHNFDIILQLGYTSSSIWSFLFSKKSTIVTNMDGLEWKRTKYSSLVKKFLKYAERLAVKHSDFLVADSIGIKEHLHNRYSAESVFIPYGAHLFSEPDVTAISKYKLEKYQYDLLIARMEPENNIELILDGVVRANTRRNFLVIGNYTNSFGKYLKDKFSSESNIHFLGPIYDTTALNNIRYFSNLYFHGHSVGGTNPSLLEAMASSSLICAHHNIFNLSVLDHNGHFFSTSEDVTQILQNVKKTDLELEKVKANLRKVDEVYNWKKVIDQYEALFDSLLSKLASKKN